MRIPLALTTAVVAAASIVGLADLGSVASAAEPAPTATEADVSIQGTRRFWIENLTSQDLVVDDVFATTTNGDFVFGPDHRTTTPVKFHPEDRAPYRGFTLRPGEHLTLEVRDWMDHGITVKLVSPETGARATVETHVIALNRFSYVKDSSFRSEAGGANITLFDAAG
jgi:hypothetical protein